jgi:predicted heme/steroid binding protein
MFKEFNMKELAENNGKNGVPALIAYKGKVFDVSKSFLWQKGNHQVLHKAGEDLTEKLSEAPHGAELLERFPVVGSLKEYPLEKMI